MLTVRGLRKSFHHRPVLNDVSFYIGEGETVALFGPNGAGKTTLLRILAGVTSKDSGTISFSNDHKNVLYLGHSPGLYPALTAIENMKLLASLHGQSLDLELADSALDEFSLLSRKNDSIRVFSQGLLQRLKLVAAKVLVWDILLVDEPFSTLDEEGEEIVNQLFGKWKEEARTVLMVDHDHGRAGAICHREFQLLDGKITENGQVP